MSLFTNKYHLILASNSPRRKELLSGIDVEYEVLTLPDIDESYPDDIPHEEIPEYLAKKKASAYISMMQDDTLLITADTVVLLHGRILGKPLNKRDAKRMLKKLSGETHRVVTGVSLTSKQKQVCFSDTAHVTFGQLTDDEIDYYVEKYNPSDKAGAYGVQEWIGYVGVERIEGSYFNVMGLPIFKVYRELRRF
ncbi:Maf-like protein BF3120 [Proteiniphilum saccharofermentans]|uniref:dTTP/UTP pyrophosphatase n=1 Tax=Proteiniphilum saccharofermentans TaxID=1642647 RepID=A0A1R3T301_9BACT|nr:Maf-like protein [Proteiniphilum saccharofermentans]SCD22071.1 Maf-like protein BF3120 [Proteiniphilum saccharofermentans]